MNAKFKKITHKKLILNRGWKKGAEIAFDYFLSMKSVHDENIKPSLEMTTEDRNLQITW